MTQVDRILETLDAPAPPPPVRPAPRDGCCRDRCRNLAVDGHDFCAPCLAWLRFEIDDDPLDTPGAPAPEADDDDDCTYRVGYVGGYV